MTLTTEELDDAIGRTLVGAAIASKDVDTDDEDVVSPGNPFRDILGLSASSVSSGDQSTLTDEQHDHSNL